MIVWVYMTAWNFWLSKTLVSSDCLPKPSCHQFLLFCLESMLTLWLLILRPKIKHFSCLKCYFEPVNIQRMFILAFLVIAVVPSAQKEAGVHTGNESPLYFYNQVHINWHIQVEFKGPLTMILFTSQCKCPWRAIVSWNIFLYFFQVSYRTNKKSRKNLWQKLAYIQVSDKLELAQCRWFHLQ
jgi:hypothetical protein